MSLADYLSGLPSPDFTVVPGFADVYPNVRVRGLVQPAVWLGSYAKQGEPVLVGLIGGKTAGQCVVLGRVGVPLPVKAQVTAAPGGSDTITVSADGTDYVVTFLSTYTPVVGDSVRLLWQGGEGTVLAKVGSTPASTTAGPATAPPPGAAQSGALAVVASDSATYSPGFGWNSYYGQNVYQGDGSGWGAPSVNNGAWFYGGGAGQLAGATITGVQFRLPARKSGGASSATATAHIYLHTSANRPGGDVSRTTGPVDVSVPAGYGGGTITLPASWGSTLVAGGGISISGSPYMGFRGRGEDPASGQLTLSWQR